MQPIRKRVPRERSEARPPRPLHDNPGHRWAVSATRAGRACKLRWLGAGPRWLLTAVMSRTSGPARARVVLVTGAAVIIIRGSSKYSTGATPTSAHLGPARCGATPGNRAPTPHAHLEGNALAFSPAILRLIHGARIRGVVPACGAAEPEFNEHVPYCHCGRFPPGAAIHGTQTPSSPRVKSAERPPAPPHTQLRARMWPAALLATCGVCSGSTSRGHPSSQCVTRPPPDAVASPLSRHRWPVVLQWSRVLTRIHPHSHSPRAPARGMCTHLLLVPLQRRLSEPCSPAPARLPTCLVHACSSRPQTSKLKTKGPHSP